MDDYVRQPVPGPQSPHLSMASSVEKLEESAERMSMGSDITGEIQRVWAEQKRRDSDRDAAMNSPAPTRKRSSSSASRSIIDTNSTARRGGFSPAGYVPSPHPTFRSSNSDTGLARQDTTSDSPQCQIIENSGEYSFNGLDHNKPVTPAPSPSTSAAPAPLNLRRRRPSPSQSTSRPPLSPVNEMGRHRSSSSTSSRRYCNYQHTSAQRADGLRRPSAGSDMIRPMLAAPVAQHDVDRSMSTTSKSTLHHAASLFRDFDGIHYSPIAGDPTDGYIPYDERGEDEDEDDEIENGKSKGGRMYAEIPQSDHLDLEQHSTINPCMHEQSQTIVDIDGLDIDFDKGKNEQMHQKLHILPVAQSDMRWAEPPPSENMVYYPAAVPTSLNLPKRISQQPSHMINAIRRSQLLGSLPAGARQSALSVSTGGNITANLRSSDDQTAISESEEPRQQRQSVLNFTKLPPQLRASVFFDHESVSHQITVKDGSAVATLDRLLDASARAPADHSPQDLDLSGGITSRCHKRGKSSALSSLFDHKVEAGKSRMSLLPFKKFSSGKTAQLEQDNAIKDDDPIDSDDDNYQSCGDEAGEMEQQDNSDEYADNDDSNNLKENIELKAKPEMPSLEEQYLAIPNTLLAELQSRKQQLRSRNRTAATSFPNGMHSTLLELDAVEQIEKKRRQAQKTSLAWEDPTAATARHNVRDDEDVPLAVLFPTKHGLANKAGGNDWDRPLGLFEKKHLEESEPLSKRRNRLMGFDPTRAPASQTQQQLIVDGEQHSEHEDETLAQRTRRLKSTKALDDAIGNTKSDAFASDMISQFGGVDQTKQDNPTTDGEKAAGPENETLGQRRRRLQAQANLSAQPRPQIQSSRSLVRILAATPTNTIRQVSNESNSSGLLGTNAQAQAQRRNQISLHNQLSSSNLLDAPLANPSQSQRTVLGLLEATQQSQDPKRMTRLDRNQRATTTGLGAPLIGQQISNNAQTAGLVDYRQQSQHGYIETRMAAYPSQAQPKVLRQTQSFMASRFNDGSGGIRASAMPTMSSHPSSSNILPGSYVPGYAQQILPRQSTISPYGQMPAAYQQQQYLQHGMPMPQPTMQHQYPMPQMPVQTPQQAYDELMMTTKQRENIDRWRQSVMPS